MKKYKVIPLKSGWFTGRFEAVFIVLERETASAALLPPAMDPTPALLRQLLRAYNIEPEA